MAQLVDGKAQSHQFAERVIGAVHLALDCLEKRQIQTREQGAGGQSLTLVIPLGAAALHGNIWKSHTGALTGQAAFHNAAGVGIRILQGKIPPLGIVESALTPSGHPMPAEREGAPAA